MPPQGDSRRVVVHGGGILAAASDGVRIITGGDDGKVMATDASGTSTSSQATPNAAGSIMLRSAPSGSLAWSAGKQAFVRDGKGLERA